MRCEPACECRFEEKWGDYHLGRSCRLLHNNLYGDDENNSGNNTSYDNSCIPVDPSLVLRQAPVPKRIISLVSQTIDILYNEILGLIQRFRMRIIRLSHRVQKRLCHDTWALTERIVTEFQHQQTQIKSSSSAAGNSENISTCVPASMALTLHTTRSFWERALCGPPRELHICDTQTATLTKTTSATTNSYHQHHTQTTSPPHQFHKPLT